MREERREEESRLTRTRPPPARRRRRRTSLCARRPARAVLFCPRTRSVPHTQPAHLVQQEAPPSAPPEHASSTRFVRRAHVKKDNILAPTWSIHYSQRPANRLSTRPTTTHSVFISIFILGFFSHLPPSDPFLGPAAASRCVFRVSRAAACMLTAA